MKSKLGEIGTKNLIVKAIKKIGIFIGLLILFVLVLQLVSTRKIEVGINEYSKLEDSYKDTEEEYNNILKDYDENIKNLNSKKEALTEENEKLTKDIESLNNEINAVSKN